MVLLGGLLRRRQRRRGTHWCGRALGSQRSRLLPHWRIQGLLRSWCSRSTFLPGRPFGLSDSCGFCLKGLKILACVLRKPGGLFRSLLRGFERFTGGFELEFGIASLLPCGVGFLGGLVCCDLAQLEITKSSGARFWSADGLHGTITLELRFGLCGAAREICPSPHMSLRSVC